MMHPMTTKGAVEKPYSSAPSRAAMTTSRPVFIWPSTCTTIRSRSLFMTSTCWVSARPNSHGTPPCLIEVKGEAPVPPSWPEMSTTSAWALETPAATVPTPTSATSFTWTRARGLEFFRSWINCARSSRVLAGEGGLELRIIDDATLSGVDQKDPAGMQTFFEQDIFRWDIQHPHLRGHDHEPILGHVIARGPQAVAVQDRTDDRAIGEGDGGRPIPGFHQ